MLLKATEYSNY